MLNLVIVINFQVCLSFFFREIKIPRSTKWRSIGRFGSISQKSNKSALTVTLQWSKVTGTSEWNIPTNPVIHRVAGSTKTLYRSVKWKILIHCIESSVHFLLAEQSLLLIEPVNHFDYSNFRIWDEINGYDYGKFLLTYSMFTRCRTK